ncbi:MAG: rhodanese-like domain-containing protein [Bryobacterales bacterium]|nr:rhodanese-like domain-containing protein [Bryobacterales bacterium]
MTNNLEITVSAVKEMLEKKEPVRMIDVREPKEHQLCQISGSQLIPMGTIPQHLSQLEGDSEESKLIVFCHHGMRSLNVVAWLREKGVANCVSMSGGIDAWSLQVDASVPRY